MKKRILLLANSASGLYDFRNELLLQLLKDYEVHISLPDADKVPALARQGCVIHRIPLERRGMNPVKDSKLMLAYLRLIKKLAPDLVLTYTIKPNIYGSLCCRLCNVPYLVNITGLGSVFEDGGMLQKLVVGLYRIALKGASCIFFQNETNREIFHSFKIKGKACRLVPGSGVNLDRHLYEEYPAGEEPVTFLYVGRIMKEKGMDELLYTAEEIKKKYSQVCFELVGYYEEDYKELVEEKQRAGILKLTGYQKEMHPYYTKASVVVMPSYHEGMSNVILEASATGRPVLASRIPGCREGFDEGITGIGFAPKDKAALLEAAEKFMNLSYEERKQMGFNARKKMEREFDRAIVVSAYMDEINQCLGRRKNK